jgi:hypothetical protein
MSLNVNAQNSTIRNRDGLLLHSNSIQAETINIGGKSCRLVVKDALRLRF